jgi:predicted RNase H-like HicB family nuclease
MQIETTIRVWQEGDQFIAHAMPIDVASAGDTAASARVALNEAVELFVATARDAGTLNDALEEAGYTLDGMIWRAPAIVQQSSDLLTV